MGFWWCFLDFKVVTDGSDELGRGPFHPCWKAVVCALTLLRLFNQNETEP